MEVADLSHPVHGFLGFEAIDHGLDGGVRGAVLFGKALLNLANGGLAASPKNIHDLKFEPGEFRVVHAVSYGCMQYYYTCSFIASKICTKGKKSQRLGSWDCSRAA